MSWALFKLQFFFSWFIRRCHFRWYENGSVEFLSRKRRTFHDSICKFFVNKFTKKWIKFVNLTWDLIYSTESSENSMWTQLNVSKNCEKITLNFFTFKLFLYVWVFTANYWHENCNFLIKDYWESNSNVVFSSSDLTHFFTWRYRVILCFSRKSKSDTRKFWKIIFLDFHFLLVHHTKTLWGKFSFALMRLRTCASGNCFIRFKSHFTNSLFSLLAFL